MLILMDTVSCDQLESLAYRRIVGDLVYFEDIFTNYWCMQHIIGLFHNNSLYIFTF